MPRPLPDPGPGAMARLRAAAEQLRAASVVPDDVDDASAEADYETWTLARLRRRAAELDIAGRSAMSRSELIDALVALLPEPQDDDANGDR